MQIHCWKFYVKIWPKFRIHSLDMSPCMLFKRSQKVNFFRRFVQTARHTGKILLESNLAYTFAIHLWDLYFGSQVYNCFAIKNSCRIATGFSQTSKTRTSKIRPSRLQPMGKWYYLILRSFNFNISDFWPWIFDIIRWKDPSNYSWSHSQHASRGRPSLSNFTKRQQQPK